VPRYRTILLGSVVALYICVLIGTSACASPSDISSGGHEHHSHGASHLSFCAWACQASVVSVLIPACLTAESFDPVSAIYRTIPSTPSQSDLIAHLSRGPPL
jgi:hypothetical protein